MNHSPVLAAPIARAGSRASWSLASWVRRRTAAGHHSDEGNSFMKHAVSRIAGLFAAACVAAACGNLGVSGTGTPILDEDGGGPVRTVACGGSGDICCNQTACNAGLVCHSGTCVSSGQDGSTMPQQEEDSSADAPGVSSDDAASSPDAGDGPLDAGEAGEAGERGGTLDAETGETADARSDAAPPVCIASAACMTTNPGACGPGISKCDDAGVPVCRPVETTQTCYTGASGTQGVGTCKGGTQSCVGTLGACTGEVVPAAHDNCFTATDDDCNGVTGNGCPQAFTLGADRTLAAVGGTGGATTTVHCPTGAFVTRVDSWFDDADEHASGVSIYCATPTLVRGASSYSVTLTPSSPAPYQKATGAGATDERDDDCGTTGLTAITSTTGLADNAIEGLGNHCGTSAVTLAADDTLTIDFTASGNTDYNAWTDSSGTFFDSACNSNEVVVGFTVRIAAWLDSIRPICAALQVTYK
jgi:hypothetical protein